MKTEQPADAGSKMKTLAILAFHKIGKPSSGGWETWNYVPEETFSFHLTYLREFGWNVIDIAAFLAGLLRPETLPERAALLSFDDGYRSILDVALPLLQSFNYPAVLFVPTNFIGGHNAFDDGIEPQEPICDWESLRELESSGVSVQSHGVCHRRFSEIDHAQQEDELIRSKEIIEAGLSKPVDVFAFPYGDNGSNPSAVQNALRRAGYRGACLYGGGPNPVPLVNCYGLTRVAMGPDTNLHTILGQL